MLAKSSELPPRESSLNKLQDLPTAWMWRKLVLSANRAHHVALAMDFNCCVGSFIEVVENQG